MSETGFGHTERVMGGKSMHARRGEKYGGVKNGVAASGGGGVAEGSLSDAAQTMQPEVIIMEKKTRREENGLRDKPNLVGSHGKQNCVDASGNWVKEKVEICLGVAYPHSWY